MLNSYYIDPAWGKVPELILQSRQAESSVRSTCAYNTFLPFSVFLFTGVLDWKVIRKIALGVLTNWVLARSSNALFGIGTLCSYWHLLVVETNCNMREYSQGVSFNLETLVPLLSEAMAHCWYISFLAGGTAEVLQRIDCRNTGAHGSEFLDGQLLMGKILFCFMSHISSIFIFIAYPAAWYTICCTVNKDKSEDRHVEMCKGA